MSRNHLVKCTGSYNIVGTENNTAGPSIAHLETQYSWAQIRLAAYSLGSRPTGMEAPATATSTAMSNPLALLIWHTASSPCTLDEEPTIKDVELSGIRIGESTTLAPFLDYG